VPVTFLRFNCHSEYPTSKFKIPCSLFSAEGGCASGADIHRNNQFLEGLVPVTFLRFNCHREYPTSKFKIPCSLFSAEGGCASGADIHKNNQFLEGLVPVTFLRVLKESFDSALIEQ